MCPTLSPRSTYTKNARYIPNVIRSACAKFANLKTP